ncbi:oxidative stress-responsive serine-rich protein 1 isoform X1 [Ictalurus punctatus]|uniref:Oxidative stress-responsive serine-rich protein 1 n=1 Tax=Ictalurus punctatus TaxID=7998 RepID=A0A2D0QH89_ICTPU|nr:oxidative stress-responsive serine-rich protein 1 isoform X1 [Ictalurus punctatus]
MDTVKKGEKDCEEETLQTAFKKLRVDAESSVAALRGSETLAPRAGTRVSTDGTKPKITSPKENWHGCSRKSSRGLTRNQRRRRSKSPILHPPKFTYCSSKMQFKHKSPTELEDTSTSLLVPAKKELLSSRAHSPIFGSMGYDSNITLESKISPLNRVATFGNENKSEGKDERTNISLEEAQAPAADFKSLCQLQESGVCQCTSWHGMEVYSFTGLRDVISECEMKLPSSSDAPQNTRTVNGSSVSTSPRSCSEQARVYVDDITIEDLSGYMEYYLYIPKKMSHMAEMMYT